jgi:transcriptional pleiotropic regulator of transition state genes
MILAFDLSNIFLVKLVVRNSYTERKINMANQFEMVKVTSKGQMTLPASARKLLGIKKGDYLAAYINGEELILRKFTPFKKAGPQDAIFNLLGKGEGPQDLAENHDFYLKNSDESGPDK